MNLRHLRLVSVFGEAVIPLMGIFFLDWGLYFILLFYLIDLVVAEVFAYLKVHKIIRFQRIKYPNKTKYSKLGLNSFLVIIIIVLAHLAVRSIHPNIDFITESIAFLAYEEAGIPIPQGYILLPFVILGNLQQYKMLFIKTGIYQRTSWSQLLLKRRKVLFIAVIAALFIILLSLFLQPFEDLIYVLLLVGIKFYIDYKWI